MTEARLETLEFKPDFALAQERWLAFWARDLLDRPCCSIKAPKRGVSVPPGPRYLSGAQGDMRAVAEQALAHAAGVYWAGEAMPSYTPSFGPDQISAFCGAELVIPEENYGTDWVMPCVDSWDETRIALQPDNPWWQRMLEFMGVLAEVFEGKMLISHLDLHSNLDTPLAMRGGERLCMDLLDQPEVMDRVMAEVRAIYQPVYQGVYEAGRMARVGTQGWVPLYHPVRTNTIQCDFAALIGPEHFRRWALPALAEEAAFLGHCCYHLDGPECLVHVDDLCGIDGLDCIQWTTGARNKPFSEWLDLLLHIQSRGVAVWVPCDHQSIRWYHQQLDPRLVFYDCSAPDEQTADETLAWLVANT
ncbi:MAG: hypothetical protein HUU35_08495 [Armatimonadetes bacterium]|nr:hypothetical protein [Armatimonadota bacterium]